MIEIDARGLDCPKPVIELKNAIIKHPGEKIKIIVDNNVARDNVSKFAARMNYSMKEFEEEGNIVLVLTPGVGRVDSTVTDEATILICSDKLGSGDDELGKILIKGYLYTLTELDAKPQVIILMNGGVKLATIEKDPAMHLKKLKEQGVEIIVCGTCLDFFGLTEQLKTGDISNMYTIAERISEAEKLIRI
jgi:selenium metabolism protein YedF